MHAVADEQLNDGLLVGLKFVLNLSGAVLVTLPCHVLVEQCLFLTSNKEAIKLVSHQANKELFDATHLSYL